MASISSLHRYLFQPRCAIRGPVNASWLDQIEIWFSVLQRKLLQPNHFLSTASLEQAISDFIAYYNQEAKPIKWSYTVEKLERKLGTNS